MAKTVLIVIILAGLAAGLFILETSHNLSFRVRNFFGMEAKLCFKAGSRGFSFKNNQWIPVEIIQIQQHQSRYYAYVTYTGLPNTESEWVLMSYILLDQ